MVHRLRRDSDAVLIGKTTVVADNPSLTVRRVPPLKRNGTEIQPLRVVLDSHLELLVSSEKQEKEKVYHVFQDGYKTVVFYDAAAVSPPDCLPSFVMCCPVPTDTDRKLSISAILDTLEKQFQVHEVMVEGGPATAQAFLRAGTVDRCILVRASTVRFVEPLASGITETDLQQAGLQKLGTSVSGGVDQLEYWSRPDLTWPTPELANWP
jgi:riboflavin-specific deaminase-like protein